MLAVETRSSSSFHSGQARHDVDAKAVNAAPARQRDTAAASPAPSYKSHGEFVSGLASLLGTSEYAIKYSGSLYAKAADGGGRDDRRRSDDAYGRRLTNDQIFRRPEGGTDRSNSGDARRGSSDFDSDWAGRAILGRYLRGGGDWTINNDPNWTRYMTANQPLREQLTGPTQTQAQTALNDYLGGKGSTGTFNQRMHAEIQNGEGIVGYQYLHGTDATTGDFQMAGNTQVKKLADGNYEVTLNTKYTWNDNIDPNPQYQTDNWKNRIAEAITLGQADPYQIHINWDAQSKVVLDPKGNVVSMSGYPAN